MRGRVLAFAYGLVCYAVFLVTFVYAVGFIGNVLTPTSLDGPPEGSLGAALLVDLLLLGLFAVQHSVMARAWFKDRWTRIVPPPVERATYVLASSLALILMFWLWRPLGGTVWHVEDGLGRGLLHGLFGLGWALVLATTFLIDHLDLFGVRQVWLHLRGREHREPRIVTPGPYRYVRHPLYVGWLVVFWATPTMTAAHLVFALATTAYILVAIRLEERDLVRIHGRSYEEYRRRVPMLVPSPGRKAEA